MQLKAIRYQSKLNYVPYDIDDEGKRLLLMSHCKKLALAFGSLDTDAGSTIKITKNLRICLDCFVVACRLTIEEGYLICKSTSHLFT